MAIRFFRQLIGMQEEFYIKQITEKQALGPVLEVLIETMPRDNLLSSACLDLFEHIKKENMKDLVKHLVVNHREQLTSLSYMTTFRDILLRYDQTEGYTANMDYFLEGDDEMGRKPPPNTRLMEHIAVDPAEEEYWNTSDPEEEEDEQHSQPQPMDVNDRLPSNGPATPSRPLVDYHSDEESDENADPEAATAKAEQDATAAQADPDASPEATAPLPPLERVSEKRRREEDEDDELGKLMQNKRRNSSSSENNSTAGSRMAGRRRSYGANGKIAISLSPALKTGGEARSDEES